MSAITTNGNRHVTARGTIDGVVTAVPATVVDNAAYGPEADEACQVTGVKSRRILPADVHPLELPHQAAAAVLERLGWSAGEVDLIVYVTQTPTQDVPADVYALKDRLRLRNDCVALQVNWSCAGYVYGLWLAMHLLANVGHRALLVCGDVSSAIMDPNDRATGPLFGDAVSATAITTVGPQQHFLLGSDGRRNIHLSKAREEYLRMNGAEVFAFTLKHVPGLFRDLMRIPGVWSPQYLLVHQANAFMLKTLHDKLSGDPCMAGLPAMIAPANVDRFGNTSSASIPLLMCDALGRQVFCDGLVPVAMLGFGAGWSWAGGRVDCAGLRVCDLVEV